MPSFEGRQGLEHLLRKKEYKGKNIIRILLRLFLLLIEVKSFKLHLILVSFQCLKPLVIASFNCFFTNHPYFQTSNIDFDLFPLCDREDFLYK